MPRKPGRGGGRGRGAAKSAGRQQLAARGLPVPTSAFSSIPSPLNGFDAPFIQLGSPAAGTPFIDVPIGTIQIMDSTKGVVPALGDATVDLTPFNLREFDVLIYNATADQATSLNTSVSTLQAASWVANQHYNGDFPPSCCMTKRMGSTPDTSVFLDAGSGGSRIAYNISVLRGVDRTQTVDASSSLTSLATSTTLTLNSITTVTDGALVLGYGGLKNDNSVLSSFSAGWDSDFQNTEGQGSGFDSVLAWGWRVNPTAGALAGPTMVFSSSDSVRGRSIAFRPRTS